MELKKEEKLQNVIESQQFTTEFLSDLFDMAEKFEDGSIALPNLSDKIIATLFYEPSTRTRLSFESAALRLGAKVVSTENAKEFSSSVKGESLADTIRIVSAYCDCIVLRHYITGAAKEASMISKVPVINAGDGKGQHPTQALLDVYTIYKEIGRLSGLKIAMVGDLASGRTVRSLCYLLSKFSNNHIIFVSPENLKIGDDIKQYLLTKDISFSEESDLNKVLPEVDIIYMTRIQKERISAEDYEAAKGKFVINSDNLELIKKNSRIMHPLPHCEEINLPIEIEQKDKRVAYFREAANGLYIRMALLNYLLN